MVAQMTSTSCWDLTGAIGVQETLRRAGVRERRGREGLKLRSGPRSHLLQRATLRAC